MTEPQRHKEVTKDTKETIKENTMELIETDSGAAVEHDGSVIEWQIRAYREGDIPAIVALGNAANAVDQPDKKMSEDELSRDCEQPQAGPPKQVIVVEGPRMEGVPEGALLGV